MSWIVPSPFIWLNIWTKTINSLVIFCVYVATDKHTLLNQSLLMDDYPQVIQANLLTNFMTMACKGTILNFCNFTRDTVILFYTWLGVAIKFESVGLNEWHLRRPPGPVVRNARRFYVAKNTRRPAITDILLLIFIYEVCVGISAKGSHKMDQSDAATTCKNVDNSSLWNWSKTREIEKNSFIGPHNWRVLRIGMQLDNW